MYNLKPIFKSALSVLIKIVILAGATYYIYNRLAIDKTVNAGFSFSSLKDVLLENKFFLLLILLLTLANWLLEIFKWQILVASVQKISFKKAVSQCLSALTASLLTPNRAGDYLAKSLYFDKNKTKKIIALNFIGHGLQLGVTVFFGVFGLAYLRFNYPVTLSLNTEMILLILAFTALIFGLKISRNWLKKLLDYYKSLRLKLFVKTGVLSVLRYLVFSHQYYFLLLLFGFNLGYFTAMPAIFSMYLLASILPGLSLTDWLIKGSAAIFAFGFLKISALLVLQVSLLMWLFNFALPAVMGSFYIVKFKVNQPKTVVSRL